MSCSLGRSFGRVLGALFFEWLVVALPNPSSLLELVLIRKRTSKETLAANWKSWLCHEFLLLSVTRVKKWALLGTKIDHYRNCKVPRGPDGWTVSPHTGKSTELHTQDIKIHVLSPLAVQADLPLWSNHKKILLPTWTAECANPFCPTQTPSSIYTETSQRFLRVQGRKWKKGLNPKTQGNIIVTISLKAHGR